MELLDTSFKGQSHSASSGCDKFASEISEYLRNLQNLVQISCSNWSVKDVYHLTVGREPVEIHQTRC